MITIIAAVSRNGLIGNSKLGGKLAWKIPEEMRFFRKETMGKVVVMGRKTAEAVGPLEGRRCIVMSTKLDYKLEGFETMNYSSIIALSYNEHVMICGGAEIYKMFADVADESIISELDMDAVGDIYMPKLGKQLKNPTTELFSSFAVVRRVKLNQ